MKNRTFRLIFLALLSIPILGLVGVKSWNYLEDHFEKQRLMRLGDAIVRLETTQASMDEVRELLGEPDNEVRQGRQVSWFYSSGVYRGHRQPTAVIEIDLETSRVVSVQFISHG